MAASSRRSAAVVVHRGAGATLEVLLVHPGGPLWAKRDDGAWSFPKGEYGDGEDPFEVACREFHEELGQALPLSDANGQGVMELGEIRQRGGKRVTAWSVPADLDVSVVHSNTFEMEWPPRSGRVAEFPEVDRAAWYGPADAATKLNPAQVELLDRLLVLLGAPARPATAPRTGR